MGLFIGQLTERLSYPPFKDLNAEKSCLFLQWHWIIAEKAKSILQLQTQKNHEVIGLDMKDCSDI